LALGTVKGLTLGAKLGMSEETKLGASEGTEETALLGTLEGPFGGALEGDAVGTLDGDCDGKAKGLAKGELDWSLLGAALGDLVARLLVWPKWDLLLLDLDFLSFQGSFFFSEAPISKPLFLLVSVFDLQEDFRCRPTQRLLFVLVLVVGGTLSLDWFVAALLFDSSMDFLEEGSPKRIARKSLSFSKRDESFWAGDCVGSNLGTVISGANGLSILAEKNKSPFLFLDIDDDLLLDDFVYFGVPEPLEDNTLAFFRFSASSHIHHGIRVEVSPEWRPPQISSSCSEFHAGWLGT
jgi:hypothetical protein